MVDADGFGEMVLGVPAAMLSNTPLTIAAVNSLLGQPVAATQHFDRPSGFCDGSEDILVERLTHAAGSLQRSSAVMIFVVVRSRPSGARC